MKLYVVWDFNIAAWDGSPLTSRKCFSDDSPFFLPFVRLRDVCAVCQMGRVTAPIAVEWQLCRHTSSKTHTSPPPHSMSHTLPTTNLAGTTPSPLPLATFSPNTLTPCRQPTMAQLHLSIRPFPLWHLTLNTFGNSTPECLFQKQNTRQAVLYAPIWEWHLNKSPFYAVRRFIWPLACCCKSGQEQSWADYLCLSLYSKHSTTGPRFLGCH